MDLNGIPGWFPQENADQLERLIAEYQVKSVIEIGSFLGLSAVWFAHRVDQVFCIDRWYEEQDWESENNLVATLRRWELPRDIFPLFRENVMRSGVWHKICPVRGHSRYVAGRVPSVDLVYIDGDHTREGAQSDIEIYQEKARRVICGDDYQRHPEFGVIEAVDKLMPGRQVSGRFWWATRGADGGWPAGGGR